VTRGSRSSYRQDTVDSPILPQTFENGEVHDWYRTVWGYSDHLVAGLLEEFGTDRTTRVLDPFCGSGTTLVECMKRGVDSAGVDANPVSCLAAKVKTNWRLRPDHLSHVWRELGRLYTRRINKADLTSDPTYVYLANSGMLERGWISAKPLRKAIALKQSIAQTGTNGSYKAALTLALLDTLLRTAANVKFGPELYCSVQKADVNVIGEFERRIEAMRKDLLIARALDRGAAVVLEGDSRYCSNLVRQLGAPKFSMVICSPPYPTEHDYTRNSRLELAFIERVTDRRTLRKIKRSMVRSNTKGIYADDADAELVADRPEIRSLVRKIDRRASAKNHGFAKLYSRVITEYFGGMRRHFESVAPLLRSGATLAYVVGDQASYLQVPIETANILSSIASDVGYDVLGIRPWRNRATRGTAKTIVENILLLRKGK
jgi:Putative RNA methylase family UPF0020